MRVVLAAGGTGGHVYPAIALGEYIRDEKQGEVLFIGVNGKMEANEVPKHAIEFMGVDASGFVGSISNRIKCLVKVEKNIGIIKKRLKEFKPDVVMGFGGYVSVPVLIAAHSLHIPVMIHEQNSVAGLANKWLAKISDGTIVCFEGAKKYFPANKVRLLGSPRASALVKSLQRKSDDVLNELHIEKKLPLGLIVMGSLGSESVNKAMVEVLTHFSKEQSVELVYATGPNHYEEMKAMVGELSSTIHVVPFVDQEKLLPHLDFMVCRAGATTIAELCAIGMPSIVIPSPYVAHNHQEINAGELFDHEACLVIHEKDLTSSKMIDTILGLVSNRELRDKLHEHALALGKTTASEDIYNYMNELVR